MPELEEKNKKVFVFEKVTHLWDFALREWERLGKSAFNEKGNFIVSFSGGKTPIPFYKTLTSLNNTPSWKKTHIFLTDERFVPLGDIDSNYGMIRQNLLDYINIPKKNIHPVQIEKNIKDSAKKYEENIIKFFNLRKGQLPVFDLIILGIGEDGHTASLFCDDVTLNEHEYLVTTTIPKTAKHQRITFTLPVINNAKNIIFLVTGENKANIIKNILQEENSNLPACLIRPANGSISFLLDKKAGTLLKNKKGK